MLLVLVALMMATILATSYLASRDNSAALGENVSASASARWAAVTGLDIGAALLQTESNWRTAHVGGLIIDDMPVGPGTFDLNLTDLLTNAPPTSTTESVLLTTTATADGVTQVATAIAWVSAEAPGTVDVDLSEFAVFAVDELDLNDDAVITRWYKAPSTKLGERILIGTSSVSAGAVAITGDATTIDTTVFHVTGASSSLVSSGNGTDVETQALLDLIPVPQPPSPAVPAPGSAGITFPHVVFASTSTINSNSRYASMTVMTSATQALVGNITVVSEGDLAISGNSRLIVNGNVKLVVFDDLTITGSSIQLAPNATLTLYVGDELRTDNGYMGEQRAVVVRDNSGNATYMDPQRLQVFSIPGYSPSTWLMEGNSIAKASIYAPPAGFRIEDTSALYGRVTGTDIELRNDGAVFYDHGMDRRIGYTNSDSSLFDGANRIKAPYLALASLDRAAVQAAASSTNTDVLPPHKQETLVDGTSPVAPVVTPPTMPTPRPLDVVYEIQSLGLDARTYEDAL
jgi:hypothetical protein